MKTTMKSFAWSIFALVLIFMASFSALAEERTEKLDSFTKIQIGGAYQVYLTQGGGHSVRVVGEKKDIDRVEVKVKSGKLSVDFKEKDGNWSMKETIKLYITFEKAEEIMLSGATSATAETSITADNLNIKLSGAGDFEAELTAKKLDCRISGAGNFDLKGTADSQYVKISGAGSYKAKNLKTTDTEIKVSGAGSASVYASGSLTANASGVASITYYGDPSSTDIDESGISNIRKR